MPPKKKQEDSKEPPLIGRVGTNLKCGIVGLPNVGKSTFFNVITKSAIPAENFPFCTIDPNESRVIVPDERFDFLCDHYKPLSKVPTHLNVVDIAGLVKGAHEGQGLGNAFLSHIRGVDALFHMVRAFDSDEVTHVEGNVDPLRDLEIIAEELRLKDEEYIVKEIDKLNKVVVRGGDKKRSTEHDTFLRLEQVVCQERRAVRSVHWSENDINILNQHLFITAKPMVYLLNLSHRDYVRKKNKWLPKIKAWIDEHDPGAVGIPFSAEFELALLNVDADDEAARKAFFEENAGAASVLERIIVQGYRTLQLQYFFTTGKDEVKAWTIQRGTKAPQAAGKIHTDMERGFIMAEVMAYADFKEAGTEAACKAAGKYKQKGREYVVEDGDIMLIKFNAGAGLSAAKKK